MEKRNSCHPVTVEWLGHIREFRVSPRLCFKVRLSAKQVKWKWFYILMKMNFISTKSLVLKVTVFETWKWPIEQWAHDVPHYGILVEQNNPAGYLKEFLVNSFFIFKAYYNLRQRVITICDSLVITTLDNCYNNNYNLRQMLQFTTFLQFTTEQTCLASIYVGKQHQTTKERQNRVKWWWIEFR